MTSGWGKYKGDYQSSWRHYNEYWVLWNKALYDLCKHFPSHSKKREISAKVGLIGRSYVSGLERHSKFNIREIVDFFYKNGREIDRILKIVRTIKEPLTVSKLQRIISAHGAFLKVLKKSTRDGNSVRSFASKYMHFHCPAVPIYDNIAASEIRKKDMYPLTYRGIERFSMPKGADETYHDFCIRFWNMYKDLRKEKFPVNVRRLDAYLLFE